MCVLETKPPGRTLVNKYSLGPRSVFSHRTDDSSSTSISSPLGHSVLPPGGPEDVGRMRQEGGGASFTPRIGGLSTEKSE